MTPRETCQGRDPVSTARDKSEPALLRSAPSRRRPARGRGSVRQPLASDPRGSAEQGKNAARLSERSRNCVLERAPPPSAHCYRRYVMRRAFAFLLILAVLLQPGAPQARAAQSEFRAFWVDAFGEGIFNEVEITKLVAATKAANLMVRMYTSVAANYDIDGLNFDRVRLPDQNLATFPGVSAWGYNPVAVARFQQLTGRVDNPRPDDAQWLAWRRDQITNIVRKVYVETYAIKPQLAISADTITYGYGPATQGGWEMTRTYREVLQDWRGWMQEGILDLNIPMNYKREHFTTEPNNQRRMYLEWNEFARDHQYARQVAIGSAIYLNFVANSVIQVRKALTPNANGNSAVGWVGYSYRTPDCYTNSSAECQPPRPGDLSRAELTRALTEPSEYDTVLPPVFSTPATVPTMPWKTAPTRGHLAGTAKTNTGIPLDQILVEVRDPETDALVMSRFTDGLGYAAFVDLAPGRYKVFIPDDARVTGKRVELVDVSAGAVARFAITPFAKGNEGRRPPKGTTPGFDPMEAQDLSNGER